MSMGPTNVLKVVYLLLHTFTILYLYFVLYDEKKYSISKFTFGILHGGNSSQVVTVRRNTYQMTAIFQHNHYLILSTSIRVPVCYRRVTQFKQFWYRIFKLHEPKPTICTLLDLSNFPGKDLLIFLILFCYAQWFFLRCISVSKDTFRFF